MKKVYCWKWKPHNFLGFMLRNSIKEEISTLELIAKIEGNSYYCYTHIRATDALQKLVKGGHLTVKYYSVGPRSVAKYKLAFKNI